MKGVFFMRISEAFDMYRDDYIRLKNQSKRTEEIHEACKRLLLTNMDDKPIEQLELADVRDWIEKIKHGRANNSVRVYVIRLRAVLTYLDIRGVKCLDARLVPVPKRDATVPTFLTESEVTAMITAAYSLRNAFIVSLIYSSGIRLSELIRLNRGQIRDKSFTVIGKGNKPRLCFIDDRTERLMERYLASRDDRNDALVVSSEFKQRMTATNIQLLVRNTAIRAGINKKVTPHTLRHSFATNFLRNNGNMRYLADLLGHSSLETTQMYAHVVNQDLRNAYVKCHSI
jgi:site-specific recombinase XerD